MFDKMLSYANYLGLVSEQTGSNETVIIAADGLRRYNSILEVTGLEVTGKF